MKCWDQEKCEGCCFQYELTSAWYKCDWCMRNPETIYPGEDKYVDKIHKWEYFDSRW